MRIQWCKNFADRMKTDRAVQGLFYATLEKIAKSWRQRILVQLKSFKLTNNWLIWNQKVAIHCIEVDFLRYITFLLRQVPVIGVFRPKIPKKM